MNITLFVNVQNVIVIIILMKEYASFVETEPTLKKRVKSGW